MTILERMQAEGDFTDTEKNIIQYILSNPSSLKEGTIGNIAKNTYSSNATIVRLCKKLGFQGIRDFRQAFLVELESNKYIVNSVDYTVPFETKETTDSIINRMYSHVLSESLLHLLLWLIFRQMRINLINVRSTYAS